MSSASAASSSTSTSQNDKSSEDRHEMKPKSLGIPNLEVELLSSDSEDDEDPIPPMADPRLDPNYEFANLLLADHSHLTPEERREISRGHIQRLVRQYWGPDDFAIPRPLRSVPRDTKKA